MTVPSNTYASGLRLVDGADMNTIANMLNGIVGGVVLNNPSISPSPASFAPASNSTTTGTTLSALSLAGGIITRSGPTAAFTDTTDTAANIFALIGTAIPVGTALNLFYVNTTVFTATLAGGTGVTISGQATIPGLTTGYLQIAPTSSTAVTIKLITPNPNVSPTPEVFVGTADNGTTQTLTTAMVIGGQVTAHLSTGGATPSLTMPTAAAIIAALAPSGFAVNSSYVLRFINANSGTATIVTNTGITTSGTLTLATATTRDFAVQMTGAATITMTSIGTGTNS